MSTVLKAAPKGSYFRTIDMLHGGRCSYSKQDIPRTKWNYWNPHFRDACEYNGLPYVLLSSDDTGDHYVVVTGREASEILDFLFNLLLTTILKGREYFIRIEDGFSIHGMNRKRANYVAQELVDQAWYLRTEGFHLNDPDGSN